ncbi:hypothetical protein ACFFRR_001105 [Megaselia abdita]
MGDEKLLTAELFTTLMKNQAEAIASIKTEIQASKNDLNAQITTISEKIEGIETTVTSHEEKLKEQDSKLKEKELKLVTHAERIKNLEISLRKKNLILHNVPEQENNEEELKDILCKLVEQNLHENINNEIEFIYRKLFWKLEKDINF